MKRLLLILTLLFSAFSPKNLFAPKPGSTEFIANEHRGACGFCGYISYHTSAGHTCFTCKEVGAHSTQDCPLKPDHSYTSPDCQDLICIADSARTKAEAQIDVARKARHIADSARNTTEAEITKSRAAAAAQAAFAAIYAARVIRLTSNTAMFATPISTACDVDEIITTIRKAEFKKVLTAARDADAAAADADKAARTANATEDYAAATTALTNAKEACERAAAAEKTAASICHTESITVNIKTLWQKPAFCR